MEVIYLGDHDPTAPLTTSTVLWQLHRVLCYYLTMITKYLHLY